MTDSNNEQQEEIKKLRAVRNSISEDPSKIKDYIKLISSEENEDYLVPLGDIQTLLTMISSSYNIKLDTVTESFLVKFSNSEEISLEEFLDHLNLCLEKQEKIILTLLTEENSEDNFDKKNILSEKNVTEKVEKIEKVEKVEKNEKNEKNEKDFDFQEGKITSINLNNLNETDDIYLMILHRTLYILKKKFDLNQEGINKIYESFSEKNKFNKLINTEKFVEILDKIFKLCKINFLDIKYPSDLFKAEIVEEYSEEKLKMVEKQIKNFMIKNRKNFNEKFKYKKSKEFYEKFLSEKKEKEKENEYAKHNNNKSKEKSSENNNNSEREKSPTNNNNKGNKLNESNANLNETKISNAKMNETKNSKISKVDPKKNDKKATQGTNKKSIITKGSKKESSNTLTSKKENNESKTAQIEELNFKLPRFKENNSPNSDKNNFDNFNKESLNNNELTEANNLVNTLKENSNFESIEDFQAKKLDEELKSVTEENHNINEPTKFVIAESIPLIIAEFIHENINIAILDMSNELQSDLRGLFDKDIIKKIEENSNYDIDSENTLKMKEYLFEKLNTQKNIKTYEGLLLTKKTQGENTNHILHILEKLRHHLDILDRKIYDLQSENNYNYGNNQENKSSFLDGVIDNSNPLNKSNINTTNNLTRGYKSKNQFKKKTKEEIRTENLQQIFDFYAKQNIFQPKTATFVQIQENFNIIVLSEYVKFANDFNFTLKKDVVIELYKKNAVNGREMKFDGFLKSLDKIAVKINDGKIKNCLNKIKRIRAIGEEKNVNYLSNKVNTLQSQSNVSNNDNRSNIRGNFVVGSTINIKSNLKKEEEKMQGTASKYNFNVDKENENNNTNNNEENTSQLDLENNENLENNTENVIPNNVKKDNKSTTSITNKTNKTNNNNNNDNNKTNYNNNNNNNNNSNNNNIEYSPNNNLEGGIIDKNEEEITSIRQNIFELKKKKLPELLEDLYEFMELDDQKIFQKKMKGFINPFNSNKMTRVEEGQIKGIIKFDAATSENIKRILKDRKEQKIKEQEEKEKLEKLKKEEEKKRIHLRHKSIDNNIYYKEKPAQKYAEIQRKHNNIIKEKETKLTWDQIEQLNFNHFITNREDDFNPNDLFDKGDDSDYDNIFEESNIAEKNGYKNSTIKSKISRHNSLKMQQSNNNSYSVKKKSSNDINSNSNHYNNLDSLSDDQNKNQRRNPQDNYYEKKNSIVPNTNNNNMRNHQRHNSDIYGSIYSNGNGINNNNIGYNGNNRYNNNNFENSAMDSNSNGSFHDDLSGPSNISKSIENRNSPKGRNGKNLNLNLNNNGNNRNYKGNNSNKNSPKSGVSSNSNNYSNLQKKYNANIDKTEKLAREMEKSRANKSAKLINKNEDMIKKSIDKIKKYL